VKGESAAQLIARSTEDELARLLDENADEPHAHLIARMLKEQPLETTHACRTASALGPSLGGYLEQRKPR
jgi:16S rRNA C1402 N4-methylase RsmH